MSYISSGRISIFPLAKARDTDRNARMFYEDNVANIIRQVIDTVGFICSPNDATDFLSGTLNDDGSKVIVKNNQELVFNLYGYYILIKPGTELFTYNPKPADNVKDYIVKALLFTDNVTKEVVGQDDKQKYQGLHIGVAADIDGVTRPENVTAHEIELFKIHTNDTEVTTTFAPESLIKFRQNSLELSIGFIDGKR